MGTSVYGMNLSSYDDAATFGMSAPTPSAFGAEKNEGLMGTLGKYDWSSLLTGMIGGGSMLAKGGIGIFNALTARDMAETQASAYRFAGEQSAADLKRQGDAAVKNIGIVQQQGLDAATLRYNALGDEIARQRVGWSGSGIDLSSRTVGKAEQTSRKNAAWDVSRISRQTKIAADNYNDQAEMAYRNSAYAKIAGDYQAELAEINGRMQKNIGIFGGIMNMIPGAAMLGIGAAKFGMSIYDSYNGNGSGGGGTSGGGFS